jgi:hypothetical protein
LLIVVTPVVLELHPTVFVMFWLLPSVKVPVAVNCCVVPSGICGIAGVMAIETSAAGVTLKVVKPLVEPAVAVTLALPWLTLVAKPWPSTVAMLLSAELHLADVVKSSVLPSLYVPVALSCFVVPKAKEGFEGVIAIESNTGGTTLRLAEAVIEPEAAVMVALPVVAVVASPLLLTPATLGDEELQLMELVRFCVLASV